MLKYQNARGDITISDSVLAAIVGTAVTNSYGIAGMSAKNEGLVSLFKWNNIDKGVVIKCDGEDITVNIHIIVTLGINILAISESITHNAKYAVESSTGFKVKEINVFVDSIRS